MLPKELRQLDLLPPLLAGDLAQLHHMRNGLVQERCCRPQMVQPALQVPVAGPHAWARPWPTHSMFRAASFQSTLTTSHAELLPFTELSVGHANCHAKDLYHLHCQGEKNKAAVSRSECHHVRLLCQVLMSEPCMVGQAPGYHDLTRPSLWLPLDTCITAHDLVKPALAT